ncbi:MAG: AI-2E family transporter [Bacteroidetes bacterium]|nr:AI-2E family transporter [Bacteroidota bacterium]
MSGKKDDDDSEKGREHAHPARRQTDLGQVVVAVVTFAALLLVLKDFINPLLVAIAGAILLWPVREQPLARSVLISGGFLTFAWLLYTLGAVLVPFVVAYILAYMLSPVCDWATDRFKISRSIPAIVITFVAIGIVVLLFVLVVPQVASELENLATRLFGQMGAIQEYMDSSSILDRLESAGLIDRDAFVSGLSSVLQDQASALANSVPDTIQSLLKSISGLLQIITVAAIMPVLIYYTLKDYTKVRNRIIELFPTVRGDRDYLVKAGSVVGNYLRGQLMISAIATFNVSVALLIFNVPFALLIGLLGGLLNMIPNIGIVITNVIGVIIAIVFGDPWLVKAIIVVVVLGLESVLEQSVLTPRIQSNQVGLHPLLIIMSLFVFGSLMGIVGLLIAVPATAILTTAYVGFKDELTLDIGSGGDRPGPFSRFRDRLKR